MPDDARPAGGSPAPAEHEQLTRLGKYVIERKLGSGGMGTVFLAKDSDLKRTVALKVLAKDRAENPVLVRRFKAEGQAAAYLQHKNIVGVYDSGQIDGFLYIALEFVEGQDVLEIIRKRGVIPVKRSIEIVRQVAEALQHAYEKQIVHRDIKPSNLLIKNDGTVKLADLGLARSIDETLDTSITRVGTTVGTVDYMSPEQARNSKGTDIRSDIYSLGCTWYHMLTGVPPYGEGSVTNKLQAHASAPLPDPRSRNERIPEGVVAVLHRMMAKQAKDRYQTPAELLEDLNNPGIARSGLSADVLAALARPSGATVVQESSSGDIFEARAPFEDSRELNSTAESLRQDALPEHIIFDDDDESPESTDQSAVTEDRPKGRPPRTRPAPGKEPPRKKAPPREEPVEAEDHSIPTRRKTKTTGGDPGKSGPLPRRQSQAERESQAASSDTARERFKHRKLPPRASDPALQPEPVRMSLDPDRIRTIVLGGIVLVILVGIGYAFSRMGGSETSPPPNVGDAAAAAPAQPQPPVVEPNPANAPGDDPSKSSSAAATPREPNDASTPARKAAEPVAGAEDLKDLNSLAAREFIPDWLFPPRKPVPAETKATVIRRPSARPGDGVPTFADAASRLTAGPAVIEFQGDGPFVIDPVSLPENSQIVIRAADGSRPVLVLSAAAVKPGEACFKSEGTVAFRGVHLVLATGAESSADVAMVQGRSLAFRDCTLQSLGPAAAGTALVRVEGVANESSGAVFENCHLRSSAGDGVQLVGERARLLAGNSLLSFEQGRAVAIAPASAAGREVTLLRSTIAAGKAAIALANDAKTTPAPVTVTLRDSTAVAVDPAATLLDLHGWPASEESLSDKPTAIGLTWKSERSALSGWNNFARMASSADALPTEFAGDSGWQKFWRSQPSGTKLNIASPELPAGFATQAASALATIGSHRDHDPGCRVNQLPTAPEELIERVRTLASARRLPADFIAYQKPGATVEFDLTKPSTLNAFLNDPSKVPDGALVQLRGAGIRAIPPLEIRNRILHLEFVPGAGAPMVVRPQPGGTAKALITIDGGAVTITNARMLLPDSDRQAYPPTLIEVTSGNLSLTNCTLAGPAEDSSRVGPLVQWSGGEKPGGLLLRNCVITGGRTAVAANLTGGLLEIDNSIVAAAGDAISIAVKDPHLPGDVVITSSTLGGGRSILNFEGPTPADTPALTVILSDTLAISSQPAASKPSMVRATAAGAKKQIKWWEDGVGYAFPGIASLAIGTDDPAAGRWEDLWGPGHVLRVCSSERAVLFESPLENLSKADPAAFRLNARCEAATWSSTGGSLGATVQEVGAPTEAKAASPPEKGTPRPRGNLPNRPRNVF